MAVRGLLCGTDMMDINAGKWETLIEWVYRDLDFQTTNKEHEDKFTELIPREDI